MISPQNINDKTLEILESTRLVDLYLFQNEFTPKNIAIMPCSSRAWQNLHEKNRNVRVHLHIATLRNDVDILVQPSALVYSIVYITPRMKLNPETLQQIIPLYRCSLRIFAQSCIARAFSNRSFKTRIDKHFQLMVNSCENIQTLVSFL